MDSQDITLIRDSLERILQDAPLEAIDHAGGTGQQAEQLWSSLEESGYALMAVPEDDGGLGASLADCLPLAFLCGQYALPTALVDTICARAICAVAGLSPSTNRLGMALADRGQVYLAHGEQVGEALLVTAGKCSLIKIGDGTLTPLERSEDGASLLAIGKAETITEVPAPQWLTQQNYRALGAAFRAAQMAGCMRKVLEITLEYTNNREQFGRPLSKFQAVQQLLSDMACETAAAAAAVELIGDALRSDPHLEGGAISEIAAAKMRCGSAAEIVAANAHQAHGAMGFTWEYSLGRYTRRLWQWQDEFGSQKEWAATLGEHLLVGNDQTLWEWVSA